jgi:hypothetical protein
MTFMEWLNFLVESVKDGDCGQDSSRGVVVKISVCRSFSRSPYQPSVSAQSRLTNSSCGPHININPLPPLALHTHFNIMPDYSSLVRSESSSPVPTLLQGSIRRRSGAYKWSTLSRKASTGSQQATSCRSWNTHDTEADGPNGRVFTTASSPSPNASHFTTIPTRSHRSSLASSHLDAYPRQREFRPTLSSATSLTKSTSDYDDTFQLRAHWNSDDNLSSSRLSAAPLAEGSSAISQFSMKLLLLARQVPPKAHSGLVSLRRKVLSLHKLRLPSYNPSKSPPPKSRLGSIPGTGSGPQPVLSMADKLTQKWPRPRSLRSMPPELRAGVYSSNGRWGLKGVGGWSQGNMEVALRDSQGLGVDRVGQWTLQKWCLLASVTTVFLLGLTFLVFSILTWFAGKSASYCTSDVLPHFDLIAYPAAPVVLITDSPALILVTFSSSLLLFASLVGVTGTLLNSRPILAVYVLLLFPSFISFVSVGYVTYKKATFSLDAKASEAWNLWYSAGARTVLQGALGCCGWAGPAHGSAPSGACYPRSPLPGCHGTLVRFELEVLTSAWGTVFSLVPLHLANIFVGLLCANHVTHRFGKGLTPARYRLTTDDILSVGLVDQKKAGLPLPPSYAPTGHGTFREDRRSIYGRARGRFV